MTLSAAVFDLVSVIAVSESADARCLDDDGLLELDYVHSLLPPDDPEGRECHGAAAKALGPIFSAARSFIASLNDGEYAARFSQSIGWTCWPELIERCFHLARLADEPSLRLCLLLLTACIERSLGDVCWHASGGSPCPPLLKDVLAAPCLAEAVGSTELGLLRTLFGSPTSINLRNIVWHGFGAPGELPQLQYASFLLVLIPTIGAKRAPSKVLAAVRHRPFVDLGDVSKRLATSPALPPSLRLPGSGSCGSLPSTHVDLSFFPAPIRPYAAGALRLYEDGRWGEFAVLLLPQIEHAFRCLFCTVNECPRRMQTAESAEYFTTWDEILRPVVGDGQPNKLHELLTSADGDLAMMLHDLLVFPAGPRLRDFLGHMEVATSSIDEVVASYLMLVTSELSCRLAGMSPSAAGPLQETAAAVSFAGHSLARCCRSSSDEIGDRRFEYEALFHPVALVKKEIVDTVSLLGSCCQSEPAELSGPPGEAEASCADLEGLSWSLLETECRQHPTECGTRLRDWATGVTHEAAAAIMSCVARLPALVLARRHAAMPNVEACGHLLLLQVASNVRQAAENVVQFDAGRKEQSSKGTLRSRQRANYEAFRIRLPSLVLLAKVCVAVVVNQLWYAATVGTSSQQRYVSSMLQLTQNLQTHTSKDSNRWAECVAVCIRLIRTKVLQTSKAG